MSVRHPELLVYWVNQFTVAPDQPGGTRHFDMARELRRRGVDCRLVASDLTLTTRAYSRRRRWWALRPMEEQIGGVPFTWLSAGSYRANDWRRGLSMLVFSAGVLLHLGRVPVERHRTVFIGSSPQLFSATATWLAARMRGCAYVFEVRDLWPESYAGVTGRTTGLEIRLLRWLADNLYRRSDAIVLLAAPNCDNVVAHGARPERVHVVPNGVDLEAMDEARSAPVDLARAGRTTFVYAGAHGPANGLDVVIDASALLAAEGREDIVVALVGDGPSKGGLEARVEALGLAGTVEFHEPVAKSDLPSVLRTADAGLMVLAPIELFASGVSPNKLFDYLACGLPVITNVPGLVAEIVEGASSGRVVPPDDPRALADAMVALADRPIDGEVLDAGRRFVAAHFDRRVLTSRFHEVLESVVDR